MTYKTGSHVWYDLILEMKVSISFQAETWEFTDALQSVAVRGPVKLGDAVHSSLPSWGCFRENPRSSPGVSYYPHLWASWQTDRPRPRPPLWTSWARGFLCVHRRHLLCVPVFQRRHPLVIIVFASVPSIVQEQSSCPAFCIVRVQPRSWHGKIPNWSWAKGVTSARRTAFTGRRYLTALFHNSFRF